jgi:hypothetical protein
VSIQIVSASNASQAVTLVYVVGNQSTFLNGTVASSLLSQLSAELVGFYLTYPPLTIAERKFIHAMHRALWFPLRPVLCQATYYIYCQKHNSKMQ